MTDFDLLIQCAAFFKMFSQGFIPVDQAKKEAAELLDKIGKHAGQQ